MIRRMVTLSALILPARILTIILLTIIVAFPVTSTLAQGRPGAASDKFFPLDELKPGMRATGYTVFVGSEPKPFELEILGVLQGFPNPRQSAVLSRLIGDELNHIGVFQGMSGSPVYINNRLLGAVAFGYQFAKDPIAGITPIEHMIEAFEVRQPGGVPPARTSSAQPRSISFSELVFNEQSPGYADLLKRIEVADPVAVSAGSATLMPIATPLAITGIAPEAVARFAPFFHSLGFAPVAGAAGAAPVSDLKKADASTLKPGSTVVVPLIRGDYSVSAAGTVTFRDGNRIYAFGHPFLSLGNADFPMHEGEVVTVLSSTASSFKLSYPTGMVGTIRGDRSPGIYGELGVSPRMIPVEIGMRTSLGARQTYRFDLVADRFLTPVLLQMTLISTIATTERTIGDSTLLVSGSISLKDLPPIRTDNRISVSANAPISAAIAASAPISTILSSGFPDLRIEKIEFDIVSRDSRQRGQVDRLWADRTELRRGEKLGLQVFTRLEDGSERVDRLDITIPADAPSGRLQLSVGDGQALQATDPRTGFTPRSPAHLVSELNRIRKPGRLYLRLTQSENGAIIKNEELPSLPPSVLATLGSDRTSGGYTLTTSRTVLEMELPSTELVISGQRSLTLNVIE